MEPKRVDPFIPDYARRLMTKWLDTKLPLPGIGESFQFQPMATHSRFWYKLLMESGDNLIFGRWCAPDGDGLYWKDYKFLLDMRLVWTGKAWVDAESEDGQQSDGGSELFESGESAGDSDALGWTVLAGVSGLSDYVAQSLVPRGD